MTCRYYHGEHEDPYKLPDESHSNDLRSRYWFIEKVVIENCSPRGKDSHWGIIEFPAYCWRDFIKRARATMEERGLAFEMDFQNGKHMGGENGQDWYSYFSGCRQRWQDVAFDVPKGPIDCRKYDLQDVDVEPWGPLGKRIGFGPVVQATYRGVADTRFESKIPVFEITNLDGDRLYVHAPGWKFRHGLFTVSNPFVGDGDDESDVVVYDKRLHVALAKLVLDDDAPMLRVGARLPLPTWSEAAQEMKRYRLSSPEFRPL